MSPNLQTVILDIIILAEFLAVGLWFTGGKSSFPFRLLWVAFIGMGLSFVLISLGDIAILLGHKDGDFWFLARGWRALPWRYGFALGLATIGGVLRFGRFENRR